LGRSSVASAAEPEVGSARAMPTPLGILAIWHDND
jgi:hypothetical protein